jgi:hypothetical protein
MAVRGGSFSPSPAQVVGGIPIARRGYPGTPEAPTWVPLVAHWRVVDVKGGGLDIIHDSRN